MTKTELLSHLRSLYAGLEPLTRRPAGEGSCLHVPEVRAALDQILQRLGCTDHRLPSLPAEEIDTLLADLRRLGYTPTVTQVSRVLIGSASVVDAEVRALPAFRRYRGVYPRKTLALALRPWFKPSSQQPVLEDTHAPWEGEDFFESGHFDKLEAEKAGQLRREVAELGLQRATEKLPAYMQRARQRLPRSFEPWRREERALLVEAMCYTNDSDRLATIFGRSASAIRREGKRLIWNSRQKAVA